MNFSFFDKCSKVYVCMYDNLFLLAFLVLTVSFLEKMVSSGAIFDIFFLLLMKYI
jgi:hypothetical protein